MMSLFATGMNLTDSNSIKRAPRVAIFQAFVEALKWIQDDGQHAVTWRRIRVGEPLHPGTDAVIVSLLLPRSLNCRYAFGVVWAISEALRLDIPLVIYMTDWAFFRTYGEFRSIAKAGAPYFEKTIGTMLQYDESPEMMLKHGEALLEVCEAYGNPASKLWRNAQVLVPRYTNFGDVRIVQRMMPGANPVFTMDPTPLFVWYLGKTPPPSSMNARLKRWVLPALSKDNTWVERQELTWPVDRFGLKKFPVLEDEREVQAAYNRRAGAICPPYPTTGSGWWRSRWIHAARARSVLLCDQTDARSVSDAYDYDGWEYEAMNRERLGRVADEQREAINPLLQLDMELFGEQVYAPFRKAGAL